MSATADPTNVGAGQQDPGDASDPFNATAFLVRQMMSRMETVKLVQVMAVHGGGGAVARAGTVDVQPLVSQVDGNGTPTPHGTVFGLPWWRLQGGGNAVICDPVAGDVGYVACCDRDISKVKNTLAAAAPGSFRKFDLADGIYVGGCLNGPPTQYVAFTSTGIEVVDINGNAITTGPLGITLADISGNVIQMLAGQVNIVTSSFKVNGVPVTVP